MSDLQLGQIQRRPNMYNIRDPMSNLQHLRPGPAAGVRFKQVQEAKDMEKAVRHRANRLNIDIPPYDLLELIGKGSFGRVFKSRRHKERTLVAVKIIDVDSSDYKLAPVEKDQAIKDFTTEINILLTLKEAEAKNINTIYEAFSFHSQLWIVSEYCPGGSVHTLMKASAKPGLEERYVIAISRELAIAMSHVHKVGVIHRDIKAANILITQEGRLQLCDFGVSGVLESSVAKRSTIIGTPFWMPPEMHDDMINVSVPHGYGQEIDTWAYGCTVFELATGLPPNARIDPRRLQTKLKQVPRLEGGAFSAALKDFVSFCLVERPGSRPNADAILNHSYIYNSAKNYPTAILRELIDRFNNWEQSGGQRTSLFNPLAGAVGPLQLDPQAAVEDDWNFSSDGTDMEGLDNGVFVESAEGVSTTADDRSGEIHKTFTPHQKHMQDQRILRGKEAMNRLFDPDAPAYEYGHEERLDLEPESDLPLRNLAIPDYSANRTTLIDLDDAIDLDLDVPSIGNVPTIRGSGFNKFLEDDDEEEERDNFLPSNYTKRATREWTFPTHMTAPAHELAGTATTQSLDVSETVAPAHLAVDGKLDSPLLYVPTGATLAPAFRPTLVHSSTAPNPTELLHPQPSHGASLLSESPPDRASTVYIEPLDIITRPSTAASSTGESAYTDVTTTDPFDLEGRLASTRARTSFHLHTTSDSTTASFSSANNHDRGPSFSSDSELDREPPLSIKGAIESMRLATAADDRLDEYHTALRYKNTLKHMRSYHTPPTAATSFSSEPSWSHYDKNASAYYPTDLEPVAVPTIALPPLIYTKSQTGASMIGGSPPRVPEKCYPLLGPALRPRTAFPDVLGPDRAALEEDANTELVMVELDRLLGDFSCGMQVMEEMFQGEREADGIEPSNGYGFLRMI